MNLKNLEYRAYIPANFKNFKWLSCFYRFFHISAKFRHHYKIYNLWELYWCWMEMFGNFNISSLLTYRKNYSMPYTIPSLFIILLTSVSLLNIIVFLTTHLCTLKIFPTFDKFAFSQLDSTTTFIINPLHRTN